MTAFLGYVLPYGQMSLWGVDRTKFIRTFSLIFYYNSIVYFFIEKCKLTNKRKYSNKVNTSLVQPDKKFMSMFIGFIDGDGYFDIGEQKQYNKRSKELVKSTIRIRLAINVHSRDLPLLKYFIKVLGVGKIGKMSNRNQVRLIFYKKDLIEIIIPLIEKNNLKFLTKERNKQYALLIYILDNNITEWNKVYLKEYSINLNNYNVMFYLDLEYFHDWIIGFTIAEGSFGIKNDGSAFFQIRQTGIEAYEIIKAICLVIAKREAYVIKPDKSNSYQLSLSSKKDIQSVINFFSSIKNHELIGYKLIQYNIWLSKLRISRRYKNLIFP